MEVFLSPPRIALYTSGERQACQYQHVLGALAHFFARGRGTVLAHGHWWTTFTAVSQFSYIALRPLTLQRHIDGTVFMESTEAHLGQCLKYEHQELMGMRASVLPQVLSSWPSAELQGSQP